VKAALPKTDLLEVIQCAACGGRLAFVDQQFTCTACGQVLASQESIPLFTQPPAGLVPSTKLERGPETGTPWRQANWRFLGEALAGLPPEALILDVGAGRGDFAALLDGRRSLALEVYPYPEVDVVCDLTQVNPFRPGSFDAALLMNVLEHIYATHKLLDALCQLLKPGGILLVAVPFMVKLHQVPVDFVRYTHFALERLGAEHGLAVERLEGYYDPLFFLGEGLGNLRNAVLPAMPAAQRYPARLLLGGLQALAGLLGRFSGPGKTQVPAQTRSLAPTGYHIVYRKEG
jgi:SAM-dependent methyltransferase